jgi:hypothetical protein
VESARDDYGVVISTVLARLWTRPRTTRRRAELPGGARLGDATHRQPLTRPARCCEIGLVDRWDSCLRSCHTSAGAYGTGRRTERKIGPLRRRTTQINRIDRVVRAVLEFVVRTKSDGRACTACLVALASRTLRSIRRESVRPRRCRAASAADPATIRCGKYLLDGMSVNLNGVRRRVGEVDDVSIRDDRRYSPGTVSVDRLCVVSLRSPGWTPLCGKPTVLTASVPPFRTGTILGRAIVS